MSAALVASMRGVFIPVVTPFHDSGEVDYIGLRANTVALVSACHGKDCVFVPAGTTGEAFSLSTDEHREVVAAVVDVIAGRFPVIAGASATGTHEAVRLARVLQQTGVDGILVLPPYYAIPNEEGVFQHYEEIAKNVDIGIVVYNNPSVSGAWIGPSLMARLAQIENIIASKENTPFVMNYHRMWQEVDPGNLVVLCGLGEPMYSFVGLYGCPGFFSGRVGNVAPQLAHQFLAAITCGDTVRVREILAGLAPYFRYFDKMEKKHPPSIKAWWGGGGAMMHSVIKSTMDLIGLHGGSVRSPLTDLTAEDRQELAGIVASTELFHQAVD